MDGDLRQSLEEWSDGLVEYERGRRGVMNLRNVVFSMESFSTRDMMAGNRMDVDAA